MKRSHEDIPSSPDEFESGCDENDVAVDLFNDIPAGSLALQLMPDAESSYDLVKSLNAAFTAIKAHLRLFDGSSSGLGIDLPDLPDLPVPLALQCYPDIISSASIEALIHPDWPEIPRVVMIAHQSSSRTTRANVNYPHVKQWINEAIDPQPEESIADLACIFPRLPDSMTTFAQLVYHSVRGIDHIRSFRDFIGLPMKPNVPDKKQDFPELVYNNMLKVPEGRWLVFDGRGIDGKVNAGCLYCYFARLMGARISQQARESSRVQATIDFNRTDKRPSNLTS